MNSMNGSGSFTGETSRALFDERLRLDAPDPEPDVGGAGSAAGSDAFFERGPRGGGVFGSGMGPVGPAWAAFLADGVDSPRVRLRDAARVSMRLLGPRT